MARVVQKSRANAKNKPTTQLKGDYSIEQLLAEPKLISPLRRHDCPPVTDGASAVILATREVAEKFHKRNAYITGIDHRIESHQLGTRDLLSSVSTKIAGEAAGVNRGKVDVAELHAPFSHQEILLKNALGLGESTVINPSGGTLAGNIMMSAGLSNFGEVAMRSSRARPTVAWHMPPAGHVLQQNLVAVLEGK